MFQAQREVVNRLVERAKRSYYVGLINMCGNDTKKLYSTANRLLNRKQDSLLPRHTDSQELAQRFIHFFHSKVHKIQDSLTPDLTPFDPVTSASFDTIRPTTPDEIKSLLHRLPAKSCHLDPINTVLIKECCSTFASIITHIVNLSIGQACVPSVLKTAHILPILKKPNLDPQSLSNYRPISNLPFLFKILERVVFSRLLDYCIENNLLDPFQSAYRPHHSVETLLTNVSNYVLHEMDKGKVTGMILLDLSAAFDTVNHTVLINTLISLGVNGKALQWFKSYLTLHSQGVRINGCLSDFLPLQCGVPQGSVGGPTMFMLYLTGLRNIFLQHSLSYHIYADDIQIYTSFKPNRNDAASAIHNLERCVDDVHIWLNSHSLKLNLAKCEFIMYGSKPQLEKISINSVTLAGHVVPSSTACRNLGVFLDSHMTMSTQIQRISQSVRYQLRNLGFIRKYLTRNATEKITHALISSRLDFGNALMFGLPQNALVKLQKLQNAAARIVTLTNKHSHITPVLKSLHWLPVEQRVIFKILLLLFHCIHGSAPFYNTSLIHQYAPSRSLRSQNFGLLVIPKIKTKWGERTFAHAAPSAWNSLPRTIKDSSSVEMFKSNLKTYMFNLAYN